MGRTRIGTYGMEGMDIWNGRNGHMEGYGRMGGHTEHLGTIWY